MHRRAWFAGLLVCGILIGNETDDQNGQRYLFSTKEGTFCGEFKQGVTLDFPFGAVSFSPDEIYALEPENENKMKLTTKLGEIYQGDTKENGIDINIVSLSPKKEEKHFAFSDLIYVVSESQGKSCMEVLLVETNDGYIFPIDSEEGISVSSKNGEVRVWQPRVAEDIKFPKGYIHKLSTHVSAVQDVMNAIKRRSLAFEAGKPKGDVEWQGGRLFAFEEISLEGKEDVEDETAKSSEDAAPNIFDEKYYEPKKEKYEFFLFKKSPPSAFISLIKAKWFNFSEAMQQKDVAIADEEADNSQE